MNKPHHHQLKPVRQDDQQADTSPCASNDAIALLREAVASLERSMRLLADATLLNPELDESLGIEAQRLIGVRSAMLAEVASLERAAE